MSKIKRYEYETVEPVYAVLKKNPYLTETAGFIPLDVKFKRFEQAGIAMQFNQSEFTSSDYREMFTSPDMEITPEDDFEEVQEKLMLQHQFYQKKIKESQAKNQVEAGTLKPEEKESVSKPQKENPKTEAESE